MFSPRWQDRAAVVFTLMVCAACIRMGLAVPHARRFGAKPLRPAAAYRAR